MPELGCARSRSPARRFPQDRPSATSAATAGHAPVPWSYFRLALRLRLTALSGRPAVEWAGFSGQAHGGAWPRMRPKRQPHACTAWLFEATRGI